MEADFILDYKTLTVSIELERSSKACLSLGGGVAGGGRSDGAILLYEIRFNQGWLNVYVLDNWSATKMRQ